MGSSRLQCRTYCVTNGKNNMGLIEDLQFIQLILHASVPVQLVMGLLLLVSLMSWWYIFRKLFEIRLAVSQTENFEDAFWANPDLNRLYQDAVAEHDEAGSMERIFAAGFAEFIKLKKRHGVDN